MTRAIDGENELKKSTAVRKLTPRHIRAMNLIMEGKPLCLVAQEVGVSRQTVSEWKNKNPNFKARLEELKAEADEELEYSAPMRNAYVMSQLLKLTAEGSPSERLKAIQEYFDRTGFMNAATDSAAELSETGAMLLRIMGRRQEV
jgi:DNA-binding LacI/PurR family transcriptional regulator